MSVEAIYNFIRVNEILVTGGQPTEEQLRAAAGEGFEVVINLATFSPGHSLPDEAGLVQVLGMEYHAIPVIWTDPKEADFAAFDAVMSAVAGRKILLHCAANYRATAFYSLYAMKHLGWSREEASRFRERIWAGSDYPAWKALIARIEVLITGS